ncbi:hypothetical protein BD410DRAFT_401114 [Rickenella mellea]|uniref:Uncharacterized protein n=1 Tax=Rickenella mellea TaxID=50990 RepID=A0A4Y7PYS6_9AGAM|nr:hypothetical protein BD410DRAFT_401114 [Rickenella mellea]
MLTSSPLPGTRSERTQIRVQLEPLDTVAFRIRRRFRLIKGGAPQFILVHYSRGQAVSEFVSWSFLMYPNTYSRYMKSTGPQSSMHAKRDALWTSVHVKLRPLGLGTTNWLGWFYIEELSCFLSVRRCARVGPFGCYQGFAPDESIAGCTSSSPA